MPHPSGVRRIHFLAVVPASASVAQGAAITGGRAVRSLVGPADWVQAQRASAPNPQALLGFAFHPAQDGSAIVPTGKLLLAGLEGAATTTREQIQELVHQRRLEQQDGAFFPQVIPLTPAIAEEARGLREFKASFVAAGIRG